MKKFLLLLSVLFITTLMVFAGDENNPIFSASFLKSLNTCTPDTFKTSNVDLGFLKNFAIYKIEKSNNEQLCYMHIDTTSWNEEYKSGNKFFCMLNPAQRKELAESLSKNDLSVLNKYFNTPTICKYTLKPLINLK